jgi:hypothetical protein
VIEVLKTSMKPNLKWVSFGFLKQMKTVNTFRPNRDPLNINFHRNIDLIYFVYFLQFQYFLYIGCNKFKINKGPYYYPPETSVLRLGFC